VSDGHSHSLELHNLARERISFILTHCARLQSLTLFPLFLGFLVDDFRPKTSLSLELVELITTPYTANEHRHYRMCFRPKRVIIITDDLNALIIDEIQSAIQGRWSVEHMSIFVYDIGQTFHRLSSMICAWMDQSNSKIQLHFNIAPPMEVPVFTAHPQLFVRALDKHIFNTLFEEWEARATVEV
jgi:hypothetical protein